MTIDIRSAVCRVPSVVPENWGTAFFVEPEGLLITCAHVVKNALRIDGLIPVDVFGPESNYAAPAPQRLLAEWLEHESGSPNDHDLALLRLTTGLPPGIQPLRITFDALAMSGRNIASYGFPSNRPAYGGPATGVVTGAAWDPSSSRPVIEIRSAELTGGFSGAPIVDIGTGSVVGVMMSTVTPDIRGRFKEHAWAIPTSSIPAVTRKIAGTAHPLVAELRRSATERVPTLIDFATDEDEDRTCIIAPMMRSGITGAKPTTVDDALQELIMSEDNLMVVTGVSGAGKSTLLRVALPAALARLGELPGMPAMVPIYMRATTFFSSIGGSLAERISAALTESRLINYPATTLSHELARLLGSSCYRFALLIDGLDEITHPLQRSEAASEIKELRANLQQQKHVIVLTSRPIDELKRLCADSRAPLCFALEPVTEDARHDFFRQMLSPADGDALEEQFSHFGNAELNGLPLHAAFAVSLYRKDRKLPASLVAMYEQYLDLIIERTQRSKHEMTSSPELVSELFDALQVLAYESLTHEELNDSHARAALQRCISKSAGDKFSALVIRQIAQTQLTAVTDTQLALYRENGGFKWTHLSIRDYLAGHHMAGICTEPASWDQAMARWRDPNWRGAVLFALLILARENDLPLDALRSLAPFNGQEPDDATLQFLCDAIAMGAKMPRALLMQVIDAAVCAGTDAIEDFNSCARLFKPCKHPYESLMRIRKIAPDAVARIEEIISNPNLPVATRTALARRIAR